MKGTKLILFLLIVTCCENLFAADYINCMKDPETYAKTSCENMGCQWIGNNDTSYSTGDCTIPVNKRCTKTQYYNNGCYECTNANGYSLQEINYTNNNDNYNLLKENDCNFTAICKGDIDTTTHICNNACTSGITDESTITYNNGKTTINNRTDTGCYKCGETTSTYSYNSETGVSKCECLPRYQAPNSNSRLVVSFSLDDAISAARNGDLSTYNGTKNGTTYSFNCKEITYNIKFICNLNSEIYYSPENNKPWPADAPNTVVYLNFNQITQDHFSNCKKTGYTITKWINKNNSISKEYDASSGRSGITFTDFIVDNGKTNTINFTSHFEPKTFVITFKSSTSSDATNCFESSSFNCTYDGDCTNNLSSLLYKQGNCAAPTDTPIFDGWECYKTNATGATVPCSEDTNANHITYDEIAGIIDVTTGMVKDGKDKDFKNIINLSGGEDAIFVPKFIKCPNEYYCSLSGKKKRCPAPSTSNYDDNNYEPKNNISDCYITEDTKFCPNNESDPTKCFKLETLGEDTKIHHVEQDNGIVYE